MTSSHIPAATNASYPSRPGNEVFPLIDGINAFGRICEAVESANHSVWITIAFINKDFIMPGNRGSFFEVCDKASRRGIDVRIIFWRSPELENNQPNSHFHGLDYQAEMLKEKNFQFHARWDYLPRGKCHHQKSWLVDAGTPTEIAFVGGINLGMNALVEVGHPAREQGSTHDIYCGLRGPAATDVHHNFVQRWNEASERTVSGGAWPALGETTDLQFPEVLSERCGDVDVQIGRTIRREQYTDGCPAVGASAYPIAQGEKSILEQYLKAIDAAQRTIYIEDQAIASIEALSHLESALQRGVQVVFLVPGIAEGAFAAARTKMPDLPMYEQLNKLATYDNFTLAAICSAFANNTDYCEIYVHAKAAVIDDHWATIGSCNFADRSFHSDTEMNVTFWDEKTARQFRIDLFQEHLGVETTGLSDEQALRLFKVKAEANREKKDKSEKLDGLVYSVDPTTYGLLIDIPQAPAAGIQTPAAGP